MLVYHPTSLILVDCSKLPPCPYHSSISCIATDVPLECPRLCGLCDRYELLKNIYGKDYLAPRVTMIDRRLVIEKHSTENLFFDRLSAG